MIQLKDPICYLSYYIFQKILGALELGSTSMQITFIPAKKDFIGENATVKIDHKHYKVYVHSYLCYGRSAFERRYLAKLAVVCFLYIHTYIHTWLL